MQFSSSIGSIVGTCLSSRPRLNHQVIPTAGHGPRHVQANVSAVSAATTEVRFCQNKTCVKQGGKQILQLAQDLSLPGVKVEATGCLGNCGAGPNIVLLPSGTVLKHVSTPAQLENVLREHAQLPVSAEAIEATQLRLAGNALAYAGDFRGAIDKYQQCVKLAPHAGVYRIYSNMSSAFAQLGNKQAAVDAAQQAVQAAPKDFAMAWVRLVDAHYALKQYAQAAEACRQAFKVNPTFRNMPDFKLIIKALKSQGQSDL